MFRIMFRYDVKLVACALTDLIDAAASTARHQTEHSFTLSRI